MVLRLAQAWERERVADTRRSWQRARTMAERRTKERRTNPAVPEPLERKKERRREERRESVRKAGAFTVVHGGRRDAVTGEVSLGGASFVLPGAPETETVQLELDVGGKRPLRLEGRVTSARAARTAVRHVQVRFDELDTRTELALAKWLDGVSE
ncbi:MAG: PilZ domain-containing protein [Myxococcaceae bacterium]|nr:PilZ domain-containing protein [Myxococcaceae bacterium]